MVAGEGALPDEVPFILPVRATKVAGGVYLRVNLMDPGVGPKAADPRSKEEPAGLVLVVPDKPGEVLVEAI